MVTHIPFPAAYHIGKERYVRESVVEEEGHVFLKLMMVGTAALLAIFLMGALVVLAPQPKFLHVFDTLLEGAGLLAYSSLTDVAVEITCYHRGHLFDMLGVGLQTLQQNLGIALLFSWHYRRPRCKKKPFAFNNQRYHVLVARVIPVCHTAVYRAPPSALSSRCRNPPGNAHFPFIGQQ